MDWLAGPFYETGILIWRIMLGLIGYTAGQTPKMFSAAAWNYAAYELYPWFSAIGASLLKTFFLIGFIRQSTNLRQNISLEMGIEIGIKLVLADLLMASGIPLMGICFGLAGEMSGYVLSSTEVTFAQADIDAGAVMFYWVFGIVFFLVCLVCSVVIFLTVYGRYLQLYMLVISMPIAISTMPGGHGVSQTASAWIRTFLEKTFVIVFIAVVFVLASKLCNSIDFGSLAGGAGVLDGFIQALQNIFTMILLTASVKGMDVFMKRTFGL